MCGCPDEAGEESGRRSDGDVDGERARPSRRQIEEKSVRFPPFHLTKKKGRLMRRGNGWDVDDIPAVLLKKTTTVHSTINEFLRQFWQAILPPPPSSSSLSGSGGGRVGSSKTPAEKLVKVEKMVRWLETVGDKVDGLVREAEADGIKVQLVESFFFCSFCFEESNGTD